MPQYVATHLIDVPSCRADDFEGHIISRASMLLDAIEAATGKAIAGRDSEIVIRDFGGEV